jgi:DNA-binding beta-propeller fold protein YncE
MKKAVALAILIILVVGAVASYEFFSYVSGRIAGKPHLLSSIQLPEVAGRLDHMDVDPVTHRLFVAAVTDGSLEVVDLEKGNVTRMGGFTGAHGVLFLSKYQRLYVTTDNGTVYTLTGNPLKPSASVKLSSDADNIRYDSMDDRVYVAFGQGQGAGLAVIDPSSNSVVSTVILGAHPEAFQLDLAGGAIYVNLPMLGEVARVSLANFSLMSTQKISSYLDNFPMAIDEKEGTIVVGAWFPPTALVYSLSSLKELSHVAICGDADDMFYDAGSNSILVSCGQGSMEELRLDGGSISVVSNTPTSPGARTSLFSPELGEYFVAAPQQGSDPAKILVFGLGS